MGAKITWKKVLHQGGVRLKAACAVRISSLIWGTVTGLKYLMACDLWPKGRTVLENAAREPEVVDLPSC